VRIFPRDEQFFPMFNEIAVRLTGCADLIAQLFAEPARLDELATEIKRLEHEADQLTHDVNVALDRSLVTPIDREDIHLLAHRLDNVIDLLDGTARRVQLFHVHQMRPEATRLGAVLGRAAREIQAAVAEIKKPRTLHDRTRELKRLEEEGDTIYHEAVAALFAGSPDPLEVIKWKEIFDKLEDAIDACHQVGNILESIALKNG
jgi:predicted phosphate transport protein (TIGR00153 family)